MSTYLITGTSRGIGLEIIRQLAASPASEVKTAIAVTRDTKSKALQTIIDASSGRVVNVVITDITDEKTVQKALPEIEKALSGAALDILINNAGVATWDTDGLTSATVATLVDNFRVNVGSTQAMTASLLPLLERGKTKKVINISTPLASHATTEKYVWAPCAGYKTSKTALNMLTQLYADAYKSQGFTFLLVSPGYLKTDMAGDGADLEVGVGVKAVLEIVHGATTADNGKFRNIKVAGWEKVDGPNVYDGAELPW